MKISELVDELHGIQHQFGDIDILVQNYNGVYSPSYYVGAEDLGDDTAHLVGVIYCVTKSPKKVLDNQ